MGDANTAVMSTRHDTDVDQGKCAAGESDSNNNNREDGKKETFVKEQVKTVVDDLENVLGELKVVVGDLRTLVNQIDIVTKQIDAEYGMEWAEFEKMHSLPVIQYQQIAKSLLLEHRISPGKDYIVSKETTKTVTPVSSINKTVTVSDRKPTRPTSLDVWQLQSSNHVSKKGQRSVNVWQIQRSSDNDPPPAEDKECVLNERRQLHDTLREAIPPMTNRHRRNGFVKNVANSKLSFTHKCVAAETTSTTTTSANPPPPPPPPRRYRHPPLVRQAHVQESDGSPTTESSRSKSFSSESSFEDWDPKNYSCWEAKAFNNCVVPPSPEEYCGVYEHELDLTLEPCPEDEFAFNCQESFEDPLLSSSLDLSDRHVVNTNFARVSRWASYTLNMVHSNSFPLSEELECTPASDTPSDVLNDNIPLSALDSPGTTVGYGFPTVVTYQV